MIYNRKTVFAESKGFRYLRHCTGFMVALLYISYLSYLVLLVATDDPLIQISYEYLDKFSIPDIEVCGSYSDVEISRCVFTWDDWSSTTFDGCSPFLFQTRFTNNTYCYLYASDQYFYGNAEMNVSGPWVQNIDFYFKIKNISEVTSRFLSVGTITVQIMDPEFDPLWRMNATIPTDIRMKQELELVNGFAGIQNMTTMVYFKKITLRTILPRDFLAFIGGRPNYHNTPYLSTSSKDFLLHPNDSFTDTGHFRITPASFIHEIQTEKRSHTIISVLGLAGGSFGLIAGIYIALFGRPRVNPWGLMHRFTTLEVSSSADLQNIPFVSKLNPTQDYAKQVNRLGERIKELENILKDYVFNPSILERQSERQGELQGERQLKV